MKILHVTIADKRATFSKRDGEIICGNSDYKISFTFDAEWDNHNEKTARFIWGGQYYDVPFTGTECDAPIIMTADKVEVGVYAGELQTTTGAVIPCLRSVLSKGATPRPEFGGNYTTEAEAAAEAAKASAEAAQASETASKASETASKASETSAKAAATSAQASAEAATKVLVDAETVNARISRNDKRITNIELGLTPDPFSTVAEVSHRAAVPTNALPFAEVIKVGGMTHKTEAGLVDAKVTELVSEGANLLPRATRNAQTINGVTFTVQEDNSIIANGTATAETSFEILRGGVGEKITIKQGETYTLSGCPKGGSDESYRIIVQDTGYSQNFRDYGDGDGGTAIANYTNYYAFIRIAKGYTANNLVFKPMFVRGSTAKPYSPFGTIVDTFPISAELRAFLADKGYGQGNPDNPDEYNYIDFRGVFVYKGQIVDGKWVANGEPIEIDISAYLPDDNFIKVEGGGTIKAVNEFELDAPTEILYQLKEVTV